MRKSDYIQEILIEQRTELVGFLPEGVHKIVASFIPYYFCFRFMGAFPKYSKLSSDSI